uniref:DNA-directed RNA polymerase I subunit rpa49 n=1 Tax=Araucaria cunninghamii TaxID=56994 RepID=A0A0D6QTE5_ARACU
METAEQSTKKRKRKKVEVQSDYIPPQNGYLCPFVGYFPSGYDPVKGGSEPPSLEVSAYQNTSKFRSKQLQIVATPKQASVDFVGTNHTGEGAAWQPCNYLMGVFDKEIKTLKLVPISGGRVFRMEARVRGVDYGVAEDVEDNAEGLTEEERRQRFQLLTATFGTHKSRLQAKRIEKSKLKEEALGDQAQIGKLYGEVATNSAILTKDEALAKANASVVRNIPPYDASATKREDVYCLENIILREEYDCQPDIHELIVAGTNSQASIAFQNRTEYPLYVRNRISKLRSESGEQRNRLACVFSYITHLLNFKGMPVFAIKRLVKAKATLEHDKDGKGTAHLTESSKIPGVTLAKFLKLFSDSKGDTPREKKDLLISYILVLTLIADNFETDTADIAKDLKMIMHDVVSRYKELGCQTKKSGASYRVTLPLPLTFPKLKVQSARKQRT